MPAARKTFTFVTTTPLANYCTRLERLGFLRRGSGYTAVDALFELMAPLYPVPAAAHFPARLFSFFHLVFRRGVPVRVAVRVFRRDRLERNEQQIMALLTQTDLSTAELIACVDQRLPDVHSEASLPDKLYSEPKPTCDNQPAYINHSMASAFAFEHDADQMLPCFIPDCG